MKEEINPTAETYDGLQKAYKLFNEQLFSNTLPSCLITLQRHKRTFGYYSAKRFVRRTGEHTDEIALNPAYFATRTVMEALSTLAHEMVHLWQEKNGKPGRGRYHNAEWAEKMESIGLMPSHTGKPGGRKTGDQMTHYIIKGGKYERACRNLLADQEVIEWLDTISEMTETEIRPSVKTAVSLLGIEISGKTTDVRNRTNRTKYSHECRDGKNQNIWGKAGLKVTCEECGSAFKPCVK
jgi:predicted SprT family Zn-dependent metalloprotease